MTIVTAPWAMDLARENGHTAAMSSKTKGLVPVLAYTVVVHAPVTALTWRDLRDRPATQVRGDKKIWRIASAVNTLGSVAYWLVGRRSAA
jgi:hypothetical protein